MEHPAAPLLAADLGRLQHTNSRGERGHVGIPGFIRSGANPDFEQQAGTLALAIAEACIEDLGVHGYEVIHKTELDTRAAELAATQVEQRAELPVVCKRCRRRVHGLDATKHEATVDVGVLAALYEAHQETCR